MRKILVGNRTFYIDPLEVQALYKGSDYNHVDTITYETTIHPCLYSILEFKNGKSLQIYLPVEVIARDLGFEEGINEPNSTIA